MAHEPPLESADIQSLERLSCKAGVISAGEHT